MKMKSVIAGEYTAPPAHRAHDQADLRHDPGGQHVALEDFGVAAQRGHPFLDAGTAGIVHTDHRRADLHGLIHHFADLSRRWLLTGRHRTR